MLCQEAMGVCAAPSDRLCAIQQRHLAAQKKRGGVGGSGANSALFHAAMELRTVALVFSVVTGLLALLWENPWLSRGPAGGPCPLVRPWELSACLKLIQLHCARQPRPATACARQPRPATARRFGFRVLAPPTMGCHLTPAACPQPAAAPRQRWLPMSTPACGLAIQQPRTPRPLWSTQPAGGSRLSAPAAAPWRQQQRQAGRELWTWRALM